jgi:FtsP/CotA-like multicopper oxidase with cupredoxin domain
MTMTASSPAATAASANSPTTAPASPNQNATSNSVGFSGTLTIPPLLEPQLQNGTKIFNLTLQQGQSQFLAGITSPTLGINGNYLGPTLRASQGDKVLVNVTNQIGEDTTLHWHGLHVPAAMDGGPHQVIANKAIWSPQFTIQQQAATLWYHPHLMGQTQRQVTRGLVGLFILDDNSPVQNSLPHAYGVDDLPLIFQDETIGANGQLNGNGNGGGGGGRGGGQAVTLVNGTISPTLTTPQTRLRLRLLNASSQRVYNFGFANNETFYQIGSDGGLLPAPVSLTRLRLAPAERAEIIVEVNASRQMVLQSFGGNGNGGGRGGNGNGNNFATNSLLTINWSGTANKPGGLPAQLNTIERLQAGSAIQTRDMVLGGNDRNPTINNQAMTSMAQMMDLSSALKVKLGSTEVWNLINRSGDTHAFHVHDIQFQILDRNGTTPPANEAGLKDTVMVSPRETVRIIMRFTDFADPNTPYMYHCHILLHEDNGMMGQFVVVND